MIRIKIRIGSSLKRKCSDHLSVPFYCKQTETKAKNIILADLTFVSRPGKTKQDQAEQQVVNVTFKFAHA